MTLHQFGHGLTSGLAEGWWMFFDTFFTAAMVFAANPAKYADQTNRPVADHMS